MAEPYVSVVARRRQRRRAVLAGVLGVASAALAVGLLVVLAGRADDARVNLGDETFVVGDAEVLAARIDADDGTPLLFQDLVGGTRDIWVQHVGAEPDEGWVAFRASAPGSPRSCQLRWAGDRFRDPCTDRTFPGDGAGLEAFPVTVEDGRVVVDLRRR